MFKIPLVRGRFFTRRDGLDSPPVAIISQSTARRFWPNGDPLNDRIIVGEGAGSELDERIPRQIVGVVGDIHQEGLERDPRLTVYVPLEQIPDRTMGFFDRVGGYLVWVVRTSEEPHLFSNTIQRELRKASGGLPVARIQSMDEVSVASTARRQFDMWVMTVFGCAALVLAMTGVYQ